jgi:hypothetical protein
MAAILPASAVRATMQRTGEVDQFGRSGQQQLDGDCVSLLLETGWWRVRPKGEACPGIRAWLNNLTGLPSSAPARGQASPGPPRQIQRGILFYE